MSKNKKEQEPDHKHYIYGLKGKKFQEVMTEQVNGDNWKAGRSHHFYSYPKSSQTQDPDETVVVSITSHPTDNQPGNGLVKFIEGNNSKALPWSALKPDLKNKDFPESRARYLDTPIDENTFQTDIGKANVLLDFEIARRKRISRKGFYPLTRSQVKKGISAALSHPDEDYSHKVVLDTICYFTIT